MNTRLKELRKEHLHLTLEKFGEPLGVTKSALSNLENGNRSLTDQMLLLICRTYNVNEEWLRTGNGPVFQELPEEDEFGFAVAEISDDPVVKSILIEYAKLDKPLRKAFRDFLIRSIERSKEQD
jgi:transcriptional regulator with XRE-family HTH domain